MILGSYFARFLGEYLVLLMPDRTPGKSRSRKNLSRNKEIRESFDWKHYHLGVRVVSLCELFGIIFRSKY